MNETKNWYDYSAAFLKKEFPVCCGGLLFNDESPDVRQLLPYSNAVLEIYAQKIDRDQAAFCKGLEAFAAISFDFMRLQSRFRKTGKYCSSSAEKIAKELYHDGCRMEGGYLDGLLLSYAFWPNHTRMLRFYRERFLESISSGAKLAEIGIGHGLMALMACQTVTPGGYTAIDISPYSLKYAADLFKKVKAECENIDFIEADVTSSRTHLPQVQATAALCCEIIEHVESPRLVITAARKMLREGGKLFLTTCGNMEAEDHIYQFCEPCEINELLSSERFHLEEEIVLPLKSFEDDKFKPFNYAGIYVME